MVQKPLVVVHMKLSGSVKSCLDFRICCLSGKMEAFFHGGQFPGHSILQVQVVFSGDHPWRFRHYLLLQLVLRYLALILILLELILWHLVLLHLICLELALELWVHRVH